MSTSNGLIIVWFIARRRLEKQQGNTASSFEQWANQEGPIDISEFANNGSSDGDSDVERPGPIVRRSANQQPEEQGDDAQSGRRLTPQRRKEILDRLAKEKEMRKQHVLSGKEGKFKVDKITPNVDKVAGDGRNRRNDGDKSSKTSSNERSGQEAEHENSNVNDKNRRAEREALVQQLLERKRERDAAAHHIAIGKKNNHNSDAPETQPMGNENAHPNAPADAQDAASLSTEQQLDRMEAEAQQQRKDEEEGGQIAKLEEERYRNLMRMYEVEDSEQMMEEHLLNISQQRQNKGEKGKSNAAATANSNSSSFSGKSKTKHANTTTKQGVRRRPSSAPRSREGAQTQSQQVGTRKTLYRNSKEVVARAVEEKLMEECTFRPKINTNYESKVNMPLNNRIERLAQNMGEVYRSRSTEKAHLEEEELKKACTFRPTIKKRPTTVREQIPLTDRLHHEADNRVAIREQAKRAMEEEQLANYSFTPNVKRNPVYSKNEATHRPIHERIGELQRKRNEKLQRLRMQSEMNNPDLTFSPALPESTEVLVQRRRTNRSDFEVTAGTDDVVERLSRSRTETMQRRAVSSDSFVRAEAEECTFKPRLTANSARIVAESEFFSGPNRDFLHRQHSFAKKSARELEDISQAREKPTFRPASSHSSFLAGKPGGGAEDCFTPRSEGGRSVASLQNTIDRLTYVDKERTEALRENLASQYHGQFSFKPEINPVSKILGRAMSVEELAANERNKRVKAEAARQSEEAFRETCTFKPKLVKNRASSVGRVRSKIDLKEPEELMDRITQYRKEKETKLEHTRRIMEYEELKDCTFTPSITRSRPATAKKGPVVVRGLGRYLELKELAKRKEEEQRRREEKVFLSHTDTAPSVPYTIPKPFNLHSDPQADLKKQKLQDEIRKRDMAECTFKPRTNELTNRELIERILADDEEQH